MSQPADMVLEDVVQFLKQHQLTLSTAESCTAGLVASKIANVSGCGNCLDGGFIVYSPEAKNHHLGVDFETMQRYGLTSEAVAREMVLGLANKDAGKANFFISVTGTAESDDELNGVICFAYAFKMSDNLKVFSETRKFAGERNSVRDQAAVHALISIPSLHRYFVSE